MTLTPSQQANAAYLLRKQLQASLASALNANPPFTKLEEIDELYTEYKAVFEEEQRLQELARDRMAIKVNL